ncbi:MAG: hypothetical protein A3C63_01840, partial [Candidatus Zambryskibacteria bacterium RIFCSPHIGHO2_02_FULL_39_82]
QNTILALLEYPGATMLGINKMLVDKEYRNKVIANISDPSVKTYWTKEYAGYTERFAAEAIPAIQNKIGQFTSNPLIRNIIGQEKSSFDFRDIMDKGKIMIINLSKGRVGESNANLIGSMLITKIYLAAMSRADNNEQELAKLPNFYLYVDEFQSFANKSFADILSEARKYKLNLTIAHQYIEQMEEEVRDAVFGNVGTMVTFRVGAFDAEVLEKEFAPTFEAADLVNLGIYQIYLKLMIDGVSSQPFSAKGMAPIARPEINFKEAVIKSSREQFAKPRSLVEKSIIDWHDDGAIRVKPSHAPQINQIHQVNTGQFQREPWHDAHRARSEPPIQPSFSSKFRLGDTSYKAEALTVEKKQAFMKAAEILRHHPSPPPLHKTTDGQGNTISLSTLKPSEEKKNPTKENISSLKDALSRVIHKPEVKNNPSHPNEVPEDVLRNLLKMDDTK